MRTPANFTTAAIIGTNNATIKVANSDIFFLTLLASFVLINSFSVMLFSSEAVGVFVVASCVVVSSAYTVFVPFGSIPSENTGKKRDNRKTEEKSKRSFFPKSLYRMCSICNVVYLNICI